MYQFAGDWMIACHYNITWYRILVARLSTGRWNQTSCQSLGVAAWLGGQDSCHIVFPPMRNIRGSLNNAYKSCYHTSG